MANGQRTKRKTLKPTRLELTLITAGLCLMFFAVGWTFHSVNQSSAYIVYHADRA